ncbi:MAG: UDP-N-acetylmuramoyl-L-alanyl-D-glutamate--2,6-diaminopimelate ligase [Candidatus Pacebacteria bacterium]|nr:UDP-N-acetylmuramoyl-L-alanyl-D-glutamate--2,6-diaminopimelate ligase [Candidatus Paceibacterota bacterium]
MKMKMKKIIKKFVPAFLLSWYHFLLAFLGAFFYGFPSKKIKVIGVAGTDGKSTVVSLITKILEKAGYKVASISSIRFKIGAKEWQNTLKMTMPGRLKIQKFLREAVKAKCQYAVLEVTDEGIKQYRHRYIDFQVAVLTNITPEHIEAHGSFEKMRQMNGKLFQVTKNCHIINLEDENAEYFLQFPAKEKYTYGLNKGDINTKNTQFKLHLIGDFNKYNALAAICVGLSQKIDLKTCQQALEEVKVIPGRMEVVIKEPFVVIVDYAHTVNALKSVYQTIQDSKLKTKDSKMICVFGSCGGGRDKWKRPELGKIAAQYCDKIILTNEDPYDEDPNQILSQIKSGILNLKYQMSNVFEILDRKKAIKKALQLAEPGDIVIITGKGAEPWMCVEGGRKIPWDERKIVHQEFKKIQKNAKDARPSLA